MKNRRKLFYTLVSLFTVVALFTFFFFYRYSTNDVMFLSIEETLPTEYTEDPSKRSPFYGNYSDRKLVLVQKGQTKFDFVFEANQPETANVILRDIDLTLFIPVIPLWARNSQGLESIALADREWNRQQTIFHSGSTHLEVQGGDGFEQSNLYTAELSRNCLNAGLWEIQLFHMNGDEKSLYYHGWFQLPLGHYKRLFEILNNTSYWKHWHRLEHWRDPAGEEVPLNQLRMVVNETEVETTRYDDEEILAQGEQLRKARILNASDIQCFGDFCEEVNIQFPSFVKPGRYDANTPWNHEYERIAKLKKTLLRKIDSPASNDLLDEIELQFVSSRTGNTQRLIISGIDLKALPKLSTDQYPQGLTMPMGIGVPPFYQTYEELIENRPYESPYFSLLLDDQNRWINHHEVAIDGPVLHRDSINPNLIHIYLLSYERFSLIAHFTIQLDQS